MQAELIQSSQLPRVGIMRVCKLFLIQVFLLTIIQVSAQSDTTHAGLWTFHFMNTVVQQGHAAFPGGRILYTSPNHALCSDRTFKYAKRTKI
ncbi:MAG TPA: hypothetical protein PLX35_11455 [Cyclobacteriaceae bacterium]|nr:hypothetical protein [Cyclobacteriaceae bacterium]